MEEFYLGKKKVPWQLAALIDGQKCKEVGEHQWCTYILCIQVTADARALATLASNSFNIFLACNSITRLLLCMQSLTI